MGLVVVIPQDYEELPEAERERTVPICIAAHDADGNLIDPAWFSLGVEPVRKHLVKMAHVKLGDPWCVSELAEAVVHKLSARYGSSLGQYPRRRVLKKAMREATEMAAGDWRRRKKPHLYIALEELDDKIREKVLADPASNPQRFEEQLLLNECDQSLGAEGRFRCSAPFVSSAEALAGSVSAPYSGSDPTT